ncbi:MAG: DoxX family protein [Gammaproteobacteria bacterium]|nr:DoxX family protein [Gammaproteobacteria bacterium]NNJ71863.1 DoxX family protein [Enterobacterales bacterium]
MLKIITYILALVFIASGAAKLAGLEFEIQAFTRWGYPIEFMYFTGLAEVAGGLALVFNILKKYAAIGLSLVMVGAMGTHILHHEWPMLAIALVIFVLSVLLTKDLWRAAPASVASNEATTDI